MKKFILLLFTAAFFITAKANNAVTFEFCDGIDATPLKTKMEKQVSALLTAINNAAATGSDINYSGIDIDPLATQSLGQTWNMVRFTTEDNDIVDHCIRQKTKSGRLRGFQVRNIGVNMQPLDGTYDGPSRREIAIDFGPTGKIEDVNFTMGTQEYSNLIRMGEQLGDLDNRLQIIKWCERFQEAYNTCNIGFMEQVFSDDAIIITGKISTRKGARSDVRITNPQKAEYEVKTKAEYLANLKRVFRNAKYINVKFTDYKIVRHGSKPNFYGVTLKQDWATNTYKDQGIVFLVWDFTNEDEPQIHVRTWQPMTEEAFALGDFRLP